MPSPRANSSWVNPTALRISLKFQSPAILGGLAEFSVTEEKLQAGLQLVDKVEELNGQREIEKAEAQQATRERDASFVQLDIYMYKFNKVAPLVLVDKPEHLEKIGILKRSAPIRKPKSEEPPEGEGEPQGVEDTAAQAEALEKGAGAEKM